MREFADADGLRWTATVAEQDGTDYKGRYYLVLEPADGQDPVALLDVRWNSERTARRTIETMSTFELQRRLRSATSRGTPALSA